MTLDEVVPAVAEWLKATMPELGVRVYDHAVADKPLGLPDAVIEAVRTGVLLTEDSRFRMWNIQQATTYFAELDLSIMVDNTDSQAAAATLREWEGRLVRAVLSDPTLGSRVPFASPLTEFDFSSPLVQYEDGTLGREMTMNLTVGDLVEAG